MRAHDLFAADSLFKPKRRYMFGKEKKKRVCNATYLRRDMQYAIEAEKTRLLSGVESLEKLHPKFVNIMGTISAQVYLEKLSTTAC